MPSRRTNCVVVLLLAFAVGTPWPLVQSVAWVTMLARYSRQASFSQAVSMTFDGKHPCRLCHLVEQGQKEQQQQKPVYHPDESIQLGLPPQTTGLLHPPFIRPLACVPVSPDSWREPPATPPPRCA